MITSATGVFGQAHPLVANTRDSVGANAADCVLRMKNLYRLTFRCRSCGTCI